MDLNAMITNLLRRGENTQGGGCHVMMQIQRWGSSSVPMEAETGVAGVQAGSRARRGTDSAAASRRNQPCPQPDLRLLASRTGREHSSVVLCPPVGGAS